MRKILVGMKIPYAAPPLGQLRFKVGSVAYLLTLESAEKKIVGPSLLLLDFGLARLTFAPTYPFMFLIQLTPALKFLERTF